MSIDFDKKKCLKFNLTMLSENSYIEYGMFNFLSLMDR